MLEPEIIFEDDNYLILNKPSGLQVHGDGRKDVLTLADWVLKKYPELETVGEPWETNDGQTISRPGIVHRLDMETSGVIVLTKTQEAFEHLKKQFQERKVQKTYHAFVYGQLTEKSGVIDRPIGKSSKDFRLWSAQRGSRGKQREALTEYTVLKENKDTSYLEVKPKTGRTHQIRVHMKAIHHPVVCDKQYAPKQECLLGFERMALHAQRISFIDHNGEECVYESPLPHDFRQAVEQFD